MENQSSIQSAIFDLIHTYFGTAVDTLMIGSMWLRRCRTHSAKNVMHVDDKTEKCYSGPVMNISSFFDA